jgi:hypothetical protein
LVELTADRTTPRYLSRGEITFTVRVSGPSLTGTATATFYDPAGHAIQGPIHATLSGQRLTPQTAENLPRGHRDMVNSYSITSVFPCLSGGCPHPSM